MSISSPKFIYGTAWKENQTQRCVEEAFAAGFRALDTANQRKHYYEAGVGKALERILGLGQLKRSDIFLQTKFTSIEGQDQRLPYPAEAPLAVQVAQSFASSLGNLRTDYIDSYVLHGPSQGKGLADADWEIWQAMEKLCDQGQVKVLGVSNVNLEQLQRLFEGARIKPRFVQNRCFARKGWDHAIRAFCQANPITYQGFSLLTANPEIFQNPKFVKIVEKMGCTPAQTVFRFAMQIGIIPLTGTTDLVHMAEDLESSNFELNLPDLETIERLAL
jgi:diketogulonate reductase-like aldo/keto reductase